MDFRILGPFEVADGDELLELRGSRQRELLAMLLLHPNEIVSSGRLIDELWQGARRRRPRRSSRTASRSCASCSGPTGSSRGPGYLLRVEPRRARTPSASERSVAGPAEARAALREALGLWRGPRSPTSPTSRSRAPRSAGSRSSGWPRWRSGSTPSSRSAAHAELVAELEALTATHPLRERFRAQLMLALYRSGRQAEALAGLPARAPTLVERARPRAEPGAPATRAGRAPPGRLARARARSGGRAAGRGAEPAARETAQDRLGGGRGLLPLGGRGTPRRSGAPMEQAVEAVTGVLERHGASTEASTSGGVIGIFGVPTSTRTMHCARSALRPRPDTSSTG